MASVPPSVRSRRFCRATRLAVGSLSLMLVSGITACGDTLYAPDADPDDPTPQPPPGEVLPALTVQVQAPDRMELTDSIVISVRAWDPLQATGIDTIGYTAVVRNGPSERAVTGKMAVSGAPTDTVTATFLLRPSWLTPGELPADLRVEIYGLARNTAGICSAAVTTSPTVFECVRRGVAGDSVTVASTRAADLPVLVVRGRTTLFRSAGVFAPSIADMVVDAPRSRLYLSDRFHSSVQIFQPTSHSWGGDVSVGSQPWGLHINRSGDTLLVANSGGTSISFVALDGTPREVVDRRLQVRNTPLFQLELQPTTLLSDSVVYHDFSDRPEYVAQDLAGRILYSTRPTAAAPQGTVRIVTDVAGDEPETQNLVRLPEDVIATFGLDNVAVAHVDSIRGFPDGLIEVYDRDPGFPESTHLIRSDRRLPLDAIRYMRDSTASDIDFLDPDPAQDARGWVGIGSTWVLNAVSFADTTYVAVSRDRQWVAFGDGGQPSVGRVVLWHSGTARISSRVPVADLINNASERVRALELNENGTLGIARGAFGTYFFSRDLRLRGMIPEGVTGGGGAALHPNHPNTPAPNPSSDVTLAFTMSGDRTVRILDTVHYRERGRIVLRDNIAGPMRLALPFPSDNGGLGAACSGPECVVLKLFAVTDAGGVVVVDVRRADIQALP